MQITSLNIFLIYAILNLVVFNTSHAQDLRPTTICPTIDPDEIFRPLIHKKRVVGMVIGVHESGETRFFSYGETTPGSGIKPGPDHLFEIGGMVKSMTATLFTTMLANKIIGKNEPLHHFLPAHVKVPDTPARRIQLFDLASHTSGLRRVPWNLNRVERKNPYANYTKEKLYAYLARPADLYEPGERYIYSNTGFGLLGIAMSRHTQENFESLVIENICQPLELRDTRIHLNEDQTTRLMPGHESRLRLLLQQKSFRQVPAWDNPILPGACSFFSSTRDMMKWIEANRLADNPNPTILQAAIAMTHQPVKRIGTHTWSALGWHIYAAPGDPGHCVWINGATGGGCGFMGFLPGSKKSFVILCNTSNTGAVDESARKFITQLDPGDNR